eukprot:TRINITY_DN9200_c0_g1_i6.p1 TRINITY_DN9200_c0_g1~~TRINITY_DN9200_c0_g1_i6.p1  ORF type:complete len:623 (-),score=180.25 TRINITY_DN9200_c0_g1_i6:214-2082(-)
MVGGEERAAISREEALEIHNWLVTVGRNPYSGWQRMEEMKGSQIEPQFWSVCDALEHFYTASERLIGVQRRLKTRLAETEERVAEENLRVLQLQDRIVSSQEAAVAARLAELHMQQQMQERLQQQQQLHQQQQQQLQQQLTGVNERLEQQMEEADGREGRLWARIKALEQGEAHLEQELAEGSACRGTLEARVLELESSAAAMLAVELQQQVQRLKAQNAGLRAAVQAASLTTSSASTVTPAASSTPAPARQREQQGAAADDSALLSQMRRRVSELEQDAASSRAFAEGLQQRLTAADAQCVHLHMVCDAGARASAALREQLACAQAAAAAARVPSSTGASGGGPISGVDIAATSAAPMAALTLAPMAALTPIMPASSGDTPNSSGACNSSGGARSHSSHSDARCNDTRGKARGSGASGGCRDNLHAGLRGGVRSSDGSGAHGGSVCGSGGNGGAGGSTRGGSGSGGGANGSSSSSCMRGSSAPRNNSTPALHVPAHARGRSIRRAYSAAAGSSVGRPLTRRQQKRREYWAAYTPEEQQHLRDRQARRKVMLTRCVSKAGGSDGAQLPPDLAAAGAHSGAHSNAAVALRSNLAPHHSAYCADVCETHAAAALLCAMCLTGTP